MVTEHQEKSIKHIDYCYSFYFSNIFRPFSVSRYFCFGCFGLSGYFMETNPSSNAGVKYLYKKFTLSFNIKKDIISLTEYSPSFNIPISSNTYWVLVGLLFTNCRLTPSQLYLKTTVTKLPSVLNSGAGNPTRLHSSTIVPIPRPQLSRILLL